jgi:hypothetical protein
MAENPNESGSSAEDDLLRNAIPIDSEEQEEQADQVDLEADQPQEPAGDTAAGSTMGGSRMGSATDAGRSQKIRHNPAEFRKHEDHWNRTPNPTGHGAIHVKTFVAKLRTDAIEYMDKQINEWLDAHPQYEVKFATTTVGVLKGKSDEQALFVNVWV